MGGLSFETNEELMALFLALFASFETKLAQSSPPIRLENQNLSQLNRFLYLCFARISYSFREFPFCVCVSSAYIVIGVVLQQFV